MRRLDMMVEGRGIGIMVYIVSIVNEVGKR